MNQQLALGICIVLGLLLIFKELKRADGSRLAWRIAASLLAVAAFYGIMFPYQYKSAEKAKTHDLVFVSQGAEVGLLNLDTPAYTDDFNLSRQYKQLRYIPDLAYFLKSDSRYSKIRLYGYGLEKSMLANLKDYEIEFHPTTVAGFTAVHWRTKLKSSEQFLVQGKYRHEGTRPLKLLLRGLGTHLDSVILKPKSITKFSLQSSPSLIGNAVYQLTVLDRMDTVANEPLPFTMAESGYLKVLMLSSYPDFEFKFLKNWLYQQKHKVFFRTQISKDKYSTEYLNTEDRGDLKVSRSFLNSVDLVVIPEETFQEMSSQQKFLINQAIQEGMGMLLLGKQAKALRLSGTGKVLVSASRESFQLVLAGKDREYASFWSDMMTKVMRRKINAIDWAIKPQFPLQGSRTQVFVDVPQKIKAPMISINGQRFPVLQNMELLFQWNTSFWPEHGGWNKISIADQEDFFYVFHPADWQQVRGLELINKTQRALLNSSGHKAATALPESTVHRISLWWFFFFFLASAGYLWYEQRFLCNKIN